ncbi:hypothetical protein ACSQ67_015921 [Phaseolus vulgaris]
MNVQVLGDDDPTHEVKLVISDMEGQSCHFRKGVVNQPKRKVQQNHVSEPVRKNQGSHSPVSLLRASKPSCTLSLSSPASVGSLDALIGRLRAAFEENGGKPEANPFGARAVRLYLREVRDSQAKARGISYEKKKRKRPPQPPSSNATTQ